MERDARLLEMLTDRPVAARIYSWNGPWVSLGLFQRAERDLKSGCKVPWVLRPTGGRAVLHGHDVTVGLAIRLAHIAADGESCMILSRSVRRVYRRAVAPLIAALRACGTKACLGEKIKGPVRTPRSSDCFAHIGANDIVDQTTLAKVCGVAMKLTDSAVLIQASIPVQQPVCDPSEVFECPWRGDIPHIHADLLRGAIMRHVREFSESDVACPPPI